MRLSGMALLALLWTAPLLAQQWEIGAGAGYGLYRNVRVNAPAGTAAVGVRDRFVLTAILGEDLYPRISGEVRYTYQDGDPFVESGSAKANIQGQSHSFHYDVLVHTHNRESRMRPYIAVGVGAKLYRVTGPENPDQPLASIARLAARDETKPLVTAGGGIKLRVADRYRLRFEFLDYVTPFPRNVIRPAPLGTARGLFQQFTTMISLAVLLGQ
jgi:hypothetical protein